MKSSLRWKCIRMQMRIIQERSLLLLCIAIVLSFQAFCIDCFVMLTRCNAASLDSPETLDHEPKLSLKVPSEKVSTRREPVMFQIPNRPPCTKNSHHDVRA